MRMIIQVAKAELRNLFYSPVAWFLLIAFFVQCALFYTNPLFGMANWQDIMIKNKPDFQGTPFTSFTRGLFLMNGGFFSNVKDNLYLYIPLLTMSLIGREVQNGTIKLLYSSPLKIRDIVFGKYLAIMIYNLLLVLVIGIFFITAVFNVKAVDYGILLSAALGFYLLTCAYTAIGTFMSSLTTYQIVAALGTFMVIFALQMMAGLWQQYDFVRDLTFFLHLPGRTERMLYGLITSKDVIYFVVVIGMFIMFTMLKLRGAREVRPWYVKATRYISVTALCLLIGYISSRPVMTLYWDVTEQKVNTIHHKTQELLKEMKDEPLEVTLYTNFLDGTLFAGLPKARNSYLTNVWEKYQRFKPDIQFKYEYYYQYDSILMGNHLARTFPGKSVDQIAQKMAGYQEIDLDLFQKPLEMQKKIDLSPESYRLVMQLKYKGRTEFLRTFADTEIWPKEISVAAVFKRLLYPGDIPHIGFVTGHYERNIDKRGEREYRNHTSGKESRMSLVNMGFNVDTLSLDHNDIPDNLSALVLADPKSALSNVCIEKIRDYIGRGGNMFIMGEPGKQQMVNPVLQQLGVQLADGIVVQEWKEEAMDMVAGHQTTAFYSMMQDPASPQFKKWNFLKETMLTQGVAPLIITDTAGFTVSALLNTERPVTWLKKGVLVRDSAKVPFNAVEGDMRSLPPVPVSLVPGEPVKQVNGSQVSLQAGDQAGKGADEANFTVMAALQRKQANRDQRIIVCGDADLLSNKRGYQTGKFGSYFYSWLTHGDYPIYMPRPEPRDKMLSITGKSAKALGIIYVYIIPAAILLFATILLIRRKRK